MKISTKGRYALRLMLDLALSNDGQPVSLRDVAKRQGISDKYLEQIVPMLNKSDILLLTLADQLFSLVLNDIVWEHNCFHPIQIQCPFEHLCGMCGKTDMAYFSSFLCFIHLTSSVS